MKLFKLSDKIVIKGGVKLKYRLEEIFKKYNIFKYVSYMLILVALLVIIIAFLPVHNKKYATGEVVFRDAQSDVIETAPSETSSTLITVKAFTKNGYPMINQLVKEILDTL